MKLKRAGLALMFVLSLFVIPLVYAHESNLSNEDISLDKLLDSKEELNHLLNENEVLIPGGVDFIVKDGNILINISMEDETQEEFYIVISEKRIISIEDGVPEDKNYGISVGEETINDITNSEDIGGKIVESYDNGKIEIKAYGFGNKIKLFFGKIFIKIFA